MSATPKLRTTAPTIRVSTRRVQFSLALNDAAPHIGKTVTTPAEAVHIARAVIGDEITECVLAIFLDARNRVSGYAEVARGTLNSARLQPRDVFGSALLGAAASVIAAHNHPSGEVSPSRADRHVTTVLREAGTLLGVPLTDHLIVTATDHFSFREHEGWNDATETGASR
jgi:DNA repair protein RadC